MDYYKFILGFLVFVAGQVTAWFQLNGQFLWDSFSVSSLSSFHIKMTSSSPGSWGNSLAIKGFEIDGVILAYNDEVYNDGRNPSVEEP